MLNPNNDFMLNPNDDFILNANNDFIFNPYDMSNNISHQILQYNLVLTPLFKKISKTFKLPPK